MIILNPSTIIVYGLLTLALAAVWLPSGARAVPAWLMFAGLSAACGVYYGVAEIGGIVYLLALGIACHVTARSRLHRNIKLGAGLAVVGLVVALALHGIPFFHNPLVFDNYFSGTLSATYSQRWNFDKAAAGLLLLVYFGDICRSAPDWRRMPRSAGVIAIVTIALSLSLALLCGYIQFQPAFTPAFFVWAWANLFFTCIPEEMLFRGFVQKHLAACTGRPGYKIGVVIFVGLLFGLAHIGGGMRYATLAAAAGAGYGYAYLKSGRIESAILTHFLLNAIHFLFFTYPFALTTSR